MTASADALGDPAASAAAGAANPREVRRWLREIRRSHADRSIWQQFEDAYMWLFAVVLFGAMAGNVVLSLNERVTGTLYPSTLQPIVVPLALGIALRLLVSLGPIAASPATGFWLLSTPLNRSALLRPSYLSTIAITALFGPIVAMVGWAALGSSWAEVLGAGILMTALLGLTACLAVLAQRPRQRYWNSRHARWLADALLVVAAIPAVWEIWNSIEWRQTFESTEVLTVLSYSYSPPHKPTFSEELFADTPTLIGLTVLVVLAGLLRFTLRRLDRLSRTAVVAGGEAMAGLAGAAASLDLALIADMAVNRHWRQRATVRRSRRGFFVGAPALVTREMVRVLRWPRRFVVGFALLLLPYLAHQIGWRSVVPVVAALAGYAAARPFGDGLRSVGRSAGLTRALGLSPRAVRLAMAVVPGVFALIWFFLATPVLGPTPEDISAQGGLAGYSNLLDTKNGTLTRAELGLGLGFASPWEGAVVALGLAIGVLAGVIRYAIAPPPRYDGVLVSTPMGAVPPGLFSQPLRGVDVVLVSLAPVLFGLSPLWIIGIPTAVLILVIVIVPQRH
ncbi:DUF6297 family protein [Kribbella deserti]|uniref:DUF6297 family protein n=1 Tax=Kribbella deserti TaxID=1926257 RepID=A0ABV6QXG5_9ACTN